MPVGPVKPGFRPPATKKPSFAPPSQILGAVKSQKTQSVTSFVDAPAEKSKKIAEIVTSPSPQEDDDDPFTCSQSTLAGTQSQGAGELHSKEFDCPTNAEDNDDVTQANVSTSIIPDTCPEGRESIAASILGGLLDKTLDFTMDKSGDQTQLLERSTTDLNAVANLASVDFSFAESFAGGFDKELDAVMENALKDATETKDSALEITDGGVSRAAFSESFFDDTRGPPVATKTTAPLASDVDFDCTMNAVFSKVITKCKVQKSNAMSKSSAKGRKRGSSAKTSVTGEKDKPVKKRGRPKKSERSSDPPKRQKSTRRKASKRKSKDAEEEEIGSPKKQHFSYTGPSTKERLEKLQQLRTVGTWVECCNKECQKWRFLPDVKDPSEIPEVWTCDLNPDGKFSSCDIPEETITAAEESFVECAFTVGSIVWAKLPGYPFWPAIVDDDPDTETFFWTDLERPLIPTYYHVVFLDRLNKVVARAWIKASAVYKFEIENAESSSVKMNAHILSHPSSSARLGSRLQNAIEEGKKAVKMTLRERRDTYCFLNRFKGKWGLPWDAEIKQEPESEDEDQQNEE